MAIGLIALALLAGGAQVFAGAGSMRGAQRSVARAAPGLRLVPPASTRSSLDDPLGVVTTVRLGTSPSAVVYDAGRRELYVANSDTDNVSVIAEGAGAVVATVAVGTFPYGIAYDSGRNEIFVANTGSDNVSVISDATNRVVATVPLNAGDWPVAAVDDPARGSVFVANIGADTVVEISDTTNTVVNTVFMGMGAGPIALAHDSARDEIFVSLSGRASVAVIDPSTMAVATIPVGQNPMGIAYDSVRDEVYVANNGSNSVTVIAAGNDTVVATVPVGSNPTAVAYGPGTGEVVVTYRQGSPPLEFGMLGVIADGNHTLVGTVGLYSGGGATGVAYDSRNGGWYIAEPPVGALVVVAPGYYIMFTETGLSTGALWQLWLNGTTAFGAVATLYGATVPDLRAFGANGTYAFTVMPVAGYLATPSSGSVTVAGAAVSQAISFAYLYTVTFAETGLPSGTTWSVTFAGTTKSTNATSLSFGAANGTHSFTVGDVAGYVASPASGSVTVGGAAASQAIAFAPPPPGGLGTTGLALVAIVVLVGVVAGIAIVLRRRRAIPPGPGAPPSTEDAPPPNAPPP